MDASAIAQIAEMLKIELTSRSAQAQFGIIGNTPEALEFISLFLRYGASEQLLGVYAETRNDGVEQGQVQRRNLADLIIDKPEVVLIASDEKKEDLLMAALPFLEPTTRILIAGFNHFKFRDPIFDRESANSFVPSFANGYPNTLIHIFQCLKNAAHQDLKGVIAEFGMFKGGTTMLMSRFIEALGQTWKIYGFDTFDGFPEPRSPLDMYSHPDCVFLDLPAVLRLFEGRNVQVVPGDVVNTAQVLRDENVVLAFIDTDNYTSASSILDAIEDRVVPGGAIVFDHFTGRDRFLYTLGERIAAKRLLNNPSYFNLHDTGVFLRLK
jgi:hypothetical protein